MNRANIRRKVSSFSNSTGRRNWCYVSIERYAFILVCSSTDVTSTTLKQSLCYEIAFIHAFICSIP